MLVFHEILKGRLTKIYTNFVLLKTCWFIVFVECQPWDKLAEIWNLKITKVGAILEVLLRGAIIQVLKKNKPTNAAKKMIMKFQLLFYLNLLCM